MAAAKQPSIPKIPFDEAKFAAMVEPFNVRVEKIRGNARTPIPMPQSEDPTIPPGTGWSSEEIRGMENWLVTAWAGGGLYELAITDSSAQPQTMKWSVWFDEREYPPIVPPPMRGVAQQAQPQLPPVIPFQPMQVRPMSAFPNGLPGGAQPQYPYAQQQPQYAGPYGQSYYQPPPQYQLPAPPPIGSQGWGQWRDEAETRRRDDEMRQLRERETARDREALEAKHKVEIERERSANEARFARQESGMNDLRAMMTSLAQTLTNAQTQARPNAEMEILQRRLDDEKRERENERRDRELKEQMKAIQDASARQIDTLVRQMEMQAQAAREAASNRPDQLLSMMQETNRLNTEALKEIARQNTDSIKGMQTFMLSPTAMFDLAARQTSGLDSMTDKLSKTYGGVIELQTKVMENALAMQPGGTSAIDVVRDGVQGLKEMAERYTGMRTAEQRIAANAQVQIAQAQAAAIAASNGAVFPQQQPYIPSAPAQQSQLAGMPEQPNGAPRKPPVERFGRTDQEWFGPVLDEVQQLRAGVAQFIESLSVKPVRVDKDGMPIGVGPEQAAQATMQAVAFCAEKKIAALALIDLLFVDRFDDFFYVLLPDAPKNFREDTQAIFVEATKRLQGISDEDEQDEDQDGDDIDGDGSDTDGAVVEPKPSKPINKPGPRIIKPSTTTTH